MYKKLLLVVLMALAIGTSGIAAATNAAAETSDKATTTQPKDKDKEKKSVLDSVKETIGDAIGVFSHEGRTEGEEGIPRRIAVLPAVGEGDERERDDIRTAIHNNLSSKNFDLLKPFDVDRVLAQLEQTDGSTHRDFDPEVLAKKLDVEGLIYIDVPSVDKVYAAAYAHYEITITVRFYSLAENNYIWEKTESIAEREGGISLNPLSFIAQAISSAQVLTEAVRQTLVDKLARLFAGEIPFPIGERRKIKPVKIDMAIANVAEGPFRAGDEISVFMRAEPRLAATFDIGSKFAGLPMVEQGEGEYVGRYVVGDKDNANDLIVRINATRVKDRASIQWRVPGRLTIDTIAPETVSNIDYSPVKDGIRLSWPTQTSGHETLTYHIERADPQSGRYEEIAAINIQEYIDRNIVEGTNYHYRIYASDEAKNQSDYTNVQVAAVGAGPTEVTDDILSDTTWYAVASPYIINKPMRVLRGAVLTLSPGTIVRFGPDAGLEVLGQLLGVADKKSPIVFEGGHWQLKFSNTGENASRFKYARFSGGKLLVEQSLVSFSDSEFRTMDTAVALMAGAKVTMKDIELAQNHVGIRIDDGELTLKHVQFIANDIAWQAVGRQIFNVKDLRFEDNKVHVESREPMVLGNARFNDLDYQELLSRLKGDVKIDFTGVEEKDNLQAQWLKDRWQRVLEAAGSRLWQKALDGLKTVKAHAPPNDRLDSFEQILLFMTGHDNEHNDSFVLTVQRFIKRNGEGRLWVHEIKLPYSQAIANSDSYIKKQATAKVTGDYLKSHFPGLRPAEIRRYRHKLKIQDQVVDTQVLYTSKKGLFLHIWLADYLDSKKLDRSLTMAGLIQKENSALVVGLVSQTDMFELEELIIQAIKKQGLRYVMLGSGTYGNPIRAKAKKLGANIVLEAAAITEQSTSGLSKNLKMINVNLVLDLYDVATNDNLAHLTASDNKAGFKPREVSKKALIAAYGTVESRLLTSLWSADEVVAEHIKVSQAQEKQRRIAAEKAAKEKAAKEKAEQERLAAEKAAKEKAEQERLAAEKAAKERAEQERLAAEKAAKEKAEQERLAAEKAAKEKAELEQSPEDTAPKDKAAAEQTKDASKDPPLSLLR